MSVPSRKTARNLVLTRALPAPLMRRIADGYNSWANPEDRTLSSEELLRAAREIEAEILFVTAFDRISASVIADLPRSVKVIGTLSVGHEHIDIAAARARGLAVLYTPDILSDAVADMAMLLLLGAARRAHEAAELLYSGRWRGWTPTQLLGTEVTGARIGILGMGRIGRAIARRAGHGFGMRVHYHNRSRLAAEMEDGATYHATPGSLLAQSEFLVLAAPSGPATMGFLNAARIAQLPEGAIVVNIARGDLVHDEALIAALESGRVAAAGLDVFNNEPQIDEGYKRLPNVFLQPHQGSSTVRTRVRMGELLLDSIQGVLDGKSVPNRLT